MRQFRPVVTLVVRSGLRDEFRKQGHGILSAFAKAREASGELIAESIAETESAGVGQIPAEFLQTVGNAEGVGAIGDGQLWDMLVEWFKSPEGKAFFAALIKILLAALVAI
jgi:hypothetical protein